MKHTTERSRRYRIIQEGRSWLIVVYKWKPTRVKFQRLYVYTSLPGATLRAAITGFKATYNDRRGTDYRRRSHQVS